MGNNRKLKVAILGCGKIADAHAELVRTSHLARLVAACDLEPLMAEQLALRYGIERFYSDFSQMLEHERPDVVHITTPPASHLPLTLQAIDAGCHVLVEKPVAPDYAQANTMIKAALANRRQLIPGYTYKFDPAAERMRQLIAAGAIGEPVHVESFYGYNLSGPFGAAIMREPDHWVRKLPGQLLHNNIDHLMNKVAEYVTDENPEVYASGYRWSGSDLYDELRVTVTGSQVSAYATFSSRIRPDSQFLRVYGTKNSLTANYISRTVVLDAAPTLPTVVGRMLPPFSLGWRNFSAGIHNVRHFLNSDFHYFQGMRCLLDRFYQSILEDSEPPISYSELLRTIRMMDRIFAQLPTRVCVAS
jgi:predicted dehydrogenase